MKIASCAHTLYHHTEPLIFGECRTSFISNRLTVACNTSLDGFQVPLTYSCSYDGGPQEPCIHTTYFSCIIIPKFTQSMHAHSHINVSLQRLIFLCFYFRFFQFCDRLHSFRAKYIPHTDDHHNYSTWPGATCTTYSFLC